MIALTEPVGEGLDVPGGPDAEHVGDGVPEGGGGHGGDTQLHTFITEMSY